MKLLKLTPSILLSLSLLFLGACGDSDKNKEPEQLSSEKSILNFSVNDTKASIDETEKTITLSFAEGTDVSNLPIVIEVSKKAKVNPASGATVDFTNPVEFTVTAEDQSAATYTATAIVAKSSKAQILTFGISRMEETATITIDEEKKTIDVVVPHGTDVSKLTPVVTFIGKSVAPESNSTVNFTSAVTYTVTANDDSKVEYKVMVTVDLFDTQIESVSETRLYPKADIVIKGNFAQEIKDNTAELRGKDLPVIPLVVYQRWSNELKVRVPELVAEGTYKLYVTSHGARVEYDGDITVSKTMPVITEVFYRMALPRGYSSLLMFGERLSGTEIKLHARHIGADKAYNSFNLNDYKVEFKPTRLESSSGFLELGEQEIILEVDGVLSNPRIITTVERPDPTIETTEPVYAEGIVKIFGKFLGMLDPVWPKTEVHVYDEASKIYILRDTLLTSFRGGNGEGHENLQLKFADVTGLKAGDKIKVRMILMSGKTSTFSDEILVK